jgi:SAM-dependent methyltransferase
MNRDEHDRLQQSKRDQSWQRYHDGRWPDLNDRYDVTAVLVRGPAVLDVGCGQGLLLHLLGERRPDVTRRVGLDSFPGILDEAQVKLSGDFELWLDEASACPGLNAEFDTVVLGQVLEHVYDAQSVAREALRVLRPGGRLIVNVPADDDKPHGLHVRVFHDLDEVKALFVPRIEWQGWGRLHRFWFLWGEKR